MRILYLGDANSWHNQKWLEFFVEEMNHEVHILSYGSVKKMQIQVDFHKKIKVHFVKDITEIPKLRSLLTLPKAIVVLKKLIKKIAPDIIHAHGLRHYGLWGALSGFKPFVITPIGSDGIVYAKKYIVDNCFARLIYGKCDILTGDSELLLKSTIDLGMRAKKSYLIQNGVDLRMFNQKTDRTLLRKKLQLDEDIKIVISPRGFEKNYNIDTIIRSIPYVIEREPKTHFVFFFAFGQKYIDEFASLAKSLHVDKHIHFMGYIPYDEVPATLAGGDVAVSVPTSDSSPRSVYESMALGVPCVLSDIPWTKSFIVDKKNAILVPVNDHGKVANAICELLKNDDLRKNIVENAVRLVEDDIDYLKNMKRMDELYRSLIRHS